MGSDFVHPCTSAFQIPEELLALSKRGTTSVKESTKEFDIIIALYE